MSANDTATAALADLLAERLEPVVREAVEAAAKAVLAEAAPRPPARLMDVKAVGKRLGYSEESVRRYVKSGRLRAVRSLGHLRFRPEDVDDFVAGGGATP